MNIFAAKLQKYLHICKKIRIFAAENHFEIINLK